MVALLIATWLAMPLYPLNPVEQDTLNTMNMHITVGVDGPNILTDPGFEVSAKYELMFQHPFILRASADYGVAGIRSQTYPDGELHSMTLGVEALHYRGTESMTGFVGLGVLLYKGYFNFDEFDPGELMAGAKDIKVSMKPKIGYRATVGLRFDRSYSLELALSDIRPTIRLSGANGVGGIRETHDNIHLHEVRFSFGYLVPL